MIKEIKITRQVVVDDLGRLKKVMPKWTRGGSGNWEDGVKDSNGILHTNGIHLHIERAVFTGYEAEEILKAERHSQTGR